MNKLLTAAAEKRYSSQNKNTTL